MAKGEIAGTRLRPPTDAELDVADWIEAQEIKSIETMESGARQIIALITTFYGFIFGVLALGSGNFPAALSQPEVVWAGVAAIVLLLVSLGAALGVVMPQPYGYGDKRLDQMKAAYQSMLARKSERLRLSLGLFGLGLGAFALLIGLLIFARLG